MSVLVGGACGSIWNFLIVNPGVVFGVVVAGFISCPIPLPRASASCSIARSTASLLGDGLFGLPL